MRGVFSVGTVDLGGVFPPVDPANRDVEGEGQFRCRFTPATHLIGQEGNIVDASAQVSCG